jgi:hypothetical protein
MLIISISLCDIDVLIDEDEGAYKILVSDVIWLRSSYTGLYTNNRWYKTSDGSLALIDLILKEGSDELLGEWNESELIYQFEMNEKFVNISTSILEWKSIPAIIFSFSNGLNELNNEISLDMDRVQTVFPSFYIENVDNNDDLGYLTFGG